MNNRFICSIEVFLISMLVTLSASAAPIIYQFNGLVSGYVNNPIGSGLPVRVDYENLPFEHLISADTDNITSQTLAGIGTTWSNPSTGSLLNISGFDTFLLADVKVFSSPAVYRIGFGWDDSFQQSVSFVGISYALANDHPSDLVSLLDILDDSSIYPYFYNGSEVFHLTDYSSVSFSATVTEAVVPLPPAMLLMLSALLVLYPFTRSKRKYRLSD